MKCTRNKKIDFAVGVMVLIIIVSVLIALFYSKVVGGTVLIVGVTVILIALAISDRSIGFDNRTK